MRAFYIPMHIAFLLLAHAFAHVLVNPAISNVEDVLYTLGHSYSFPCQHDNII